MCELHLTELLTLTILDGLPLSGPLQKISNEQNSVHELRPSEYSGACCT